MKRVDRLLTPERLTGYPLLLASTFLIVWVISLLMGASPLPDFLARWTAGRMVVDGQVAQLYDRAAQQTIQQPIASDTLSWFVSPPPVALVLAPLGTLPYAVASVLWALISGAALVSSVRLIGGLHPAFQLLKQRQGALIAIASLPVLELMGGGQDTAFFALALALAARLIASERDLLAGLSLSIFVGKPQLALLLPIALLICRQWKVLLALGAGLLGWIGLSLAVVGARTWVNWLDVVVSPFYREAVSEAQSWKMVTVRAWVTHLLPDPIPPTIVVGIWLLLAAVIGGVFVSVVRRVSKAELPIVLVGYLPVTTLLITAHAPVYELLLTIPAVSLAIQVIHTSHIRVTAFAGFVLPFLSPALHIVGGSDWPRSIVGAPWVVVPLLMIWIGLSKWMLAQPRLLGPAESTGPVTGS